MEDAWYSTSPRSLNKTLGHYQRQQAPFRTMQGYIECHDVPHISRYQLIIASSHSTSFTQADTYLEYMMAYLTGLNTAGIGLYALGENVEYIEHKFIMFSSV